MKYGMLPKLMWSIYKPTFKRELKNVLKVDNASKVMKDAYIKYKEIILSIDEFDKGDRFIINILSAAMLSSILLTLDNKPSVEKVRIFYRNAMINNTATKMFSKSSKSYTYKGREKLKKQAKQSENISNPYSWTFSVKDGDSINEYTAYFHTCGICYLMNKLNLKKYIPAMCLLDYDMAKLNNTIFTREYTLASGGKYCDCHYNHKSKW